MRCTRDRRISERHREASRRVEEGIGPTRCFSRRGGARWLYHLCGIRRSVSVSLAACSRLRAAKPQGRPGATDRVGAAIEDGVVRIIAGEGMARSPSARRPHVSRDWTGNGTAAMVGRPFLRVQAYRLRRRGVTLAQIAHSFAHARNLRAVPSGHFGRQRRLLELGWPPPPSAHERLLTPSCRSISSRHTRELRVATRRPSLPSRQASFGRAVARLRAHRRLPELLKAPHFRHGATRELHVATRRPSFTFSSGPIRQGRCFVPCPSASA